MQLHQALKRWDTADFEVSLKAELENLPTGSLPLHLATSQGGIVDDSRITASILNSEADDNEIKIRVSVFFTEIIAGCNCSDPPLEANGYGLLLVQLDSNSGEASFSVIDE